jgi:phosphate-selective porin
MEAAPSQIEAEPTVKKVPTARTQAKVTVTTSAVSVLPATRVAEAAAAPKASTVESASRTVAPEATPVTITGCLERDAATFRLKDTTGTDAPKSRSWKKGFLKKGMAPIEVVDAANRLNLSNHVGQRVSVTGLLVDREMTLRSLQRVAASCD